MKSPWTACPTTSYVYRAQHFPHWCLIFLTQYNWSLTTASSPEVDAIFSLARSRLPTALETKFAEFAAALVETHGRDLTVSGDPSRSGTPAPAASSSGGAAGASAAAPAAPKPAEKKNNINTTKITVEGSFMAAADDLFGLLTDEKRIPLWTHASAQVRLFSACNSLPSLLRPIVPVFC
jgi:activator of HSP90 ATPase